MQKATGRWLWHGKFRDTGYCVPLYKQIVKGKTFETATSGSPFNRPVTDHKVRSAADSSSTSKEISSGAAFLLCGNLDD
jgi:hypothetical protein